MKIKPNYQNSMTEKLLRSDLKRPLAMPVNEQIASGTRSLENKKGVNLAVTSNDQLKTVLEDLSEIRVYASKLQAGKIQDSDKNVVQTRIDIIKNDISKNLANTEFNRYRNLDTDPKSTQGQTMKIKNTALEALGIESFDVRKNSNVEDLDNAMKLVRRAIHKRQQPNVPSQPSRQVSQQVRSAVVKGSAVTQNS